MADPKYADLPGIAHNEPDVYETTDLPESEQNANIYDDDDESNDNPVERIHLSAGDAFNKFRGKVLRNDKVDFTDRISRRVRTGYEALSPDEGEWELVGGTQTETVLQKYNRLQCELNELLAEVAQIEQMDKKPPNVLSPHQIEEALKRLNGLKLEEAFGADALNQPQDLQFRKLLAQLDQFRSLSVKNKAKSSGKNETGILYQLQYTPDLVQREETKRCANLEARLHRLETILGATDEKLNRLGAVDNKGLLGTAQQLSATASLLDSAQLDHIEGRLTALMQKLEMINEKKHTLNSPEHVENTKIINDLYETLKTNQNLYKLLPQTVERLIVLGKMHEKSAYCLQTFLQVENRQQEIVQNVETNKNLLQGVQESFAHNLNEINAAIMGLDGRIRDLKVGK